MQKKQESMVKLQDRSSDGAVRERFIAQGLITPGEPSYTDDGYLSPEGAERYRQKLIRDGLLKPGNGRYASTRSGAIDRKDVLYKPQIISKKVH